MNLLTKAKIYKISAIFTIGAVLLSFFVLIEPAPSDLLAAIAIILGIPAIIYTLKAIPRSVLIALVIFAAVNLIGLFVGLSRGSELTFTAITLYMVAFFLVIAGQGSLYSYLEEKGLKLNESKTKQKALSILNDFGTVVTISYLIAAIITMLLIAVGLIQLIMGENSLNTVLTEYHRPKGLFKDPNVAASFLILPVVWFASATLSFQQQVKKRSIGLWLLYLLLLFALFFTGSRGTVLAWGISYLLLLVWTKTIIANRLKHILLTGCFILLIMPLPCVNVPAMPDIGSRVMPHVAVYREVMEDLGVDLAPMRPHGLLYDYDSGGRLFAWKAALVIFQDHPLIGSGPGSFEKLSPAIERKMGVKVLTASTHSTYLRILAENGLIGLAAFLAAIAASILFVVRKGLLQHSPWILAVFIGLLINGIFIDALHWRHLWIVWALLILLAKQYCIQDNSC